VSPISTPGLCKLTSLPASYGYLLAVASMVHAIRRVPR
jgi:hypothetical protein